MKTNATLNLKETIGSEVKIATNRKNGNGRNHNGTDPTPTQVPYKTMTHYNLAIPQELYAELEQVAAEENTTVVHLIRQFIKLGLWVMKTKKDPRTALIIKEGRKERQLSLL